VILNSRMMLAAPRTSSKRGKENDVEVKGNASTLSDQKQYAQMAIPKSHGSGVQKECKFARIKRQIMALNVMSPTSLCRVFAGRNLRSIFLAGLAGCGLRALAGFFSATTILHPDRSVDQHVNRWEAFSRAG